MDKPKKRKRHTLVVIDGESLSPNSHYDFSFLETEKRLTVWFFFKNKIQHSFALHKDYNAKSIVLPRYEEDTLPYIIKRVCYELGHLEGRYHKLYFIGDVHPLWEGLVQFFRERGYVAHHLWTQDYLTLRADAAPSPPEVPAEAMLPQPAEAENNIRKTPKIPVRPEVLEKIRAGLLRETPGKKLSRREFLELLHTMGITIRKHARRYNLAVLMDYLVSEGLIDYHPDADEVLILSHEPVRS